MMMIMHCFSSAYFYIVDCIADADRARKHGLDEFVQGDPCTFDHHDLFKLLQTLTLDYRLDDAYTCLVIMRNIRI